MSSEILVINTGSSTVKMSLFHIGANGPTLHINAQMDGVDTPHGRATVMDANRNVIFDKSWLGDGGPHSHEDGVAYLIERITETTANRRPDAIGHRVVHGGSRYQMPIHIDANVRFYLESLIPLAPLHQPANLKGIDAAGRAFPGVLQVACFDTAFHVGRPFVAQTFALPRDYYDQGVRRYGFHGLSYEYIATAIQQIAPNLARGRMVVCHLGNGSSLCAIRDGKCVDTTMGFTAVEGLPMGTRCGQLDPGVILYLLTEKNMNVREVSDLVYKKSGLLGLSGLSSDMRDLLKAEHSHAEAAVDYFVYRVVWYIGALVAALGGLDGIIFTAGIGERSSSIRERICRDLAWLGLDLDKIANQADKLQISKPTSRVSAWVIPTNEALMIARHVTRLLTGSPGS